MSQQIINVGVTSNDGTGDTLRVSQQKANSNFDELYARPDFTDAPSDSNIYGRKNGDWELITGGGSTPNIQAVTDVGKVTTNEIKAKWFEFYDVSNDAYSKLKVEGNVFTFYDYADNIIKMFQNDGVEITSQSGGINRLIKDIGLLTNDRNRTEPDKDGTYAMLDDIPTVPTTATDLDALKRDGSNANSDVDLGIQSLKAASVIVDTNGSTKYVEIKSDNVSAGGYTQQLQEKNATFAYMDDVQSAKDYADSLVVGLWDDRGNYDASSGAYPSSGGSGTAGAILKGDIWTISVAGTLPTGQVVEIGDTVRAKVNTPANTQANWAIQQNNIGYTAENSANKTDTMSGNTTSSTKYLSAKGVYDWATGLFWQAIDATTSVKGIMKLFTGTGTATDGTMTQKAITDELGAKANLASPTLTGNPTAPTRAANDNSTNIATTAYVDTGLALKAGKSDIMILSSAYVLSNSTSLQKAFNVGSGGGGAFNASANKTYRFRCELDMTGLSGSTSAISFGFLGTATISSLSYKSNAIKAVLSNTSGGTITSIQVATISAITATSTATAAKAMITGIIRVSGAGTIIPAVATGVGNTTSQVEANSFFEINELGSDTLTATSNIS